MSENQLPRVISVGDVPKDDPVFSRGGWDWVTQVTNRTDGETIIIPPGATVRLPAYIDWHSVSERAGEVRPLVQVGPDGVSQFVRVINSEKPGVICIAFRRKNGKIEILLTEEFRAPMGMFYLHSAMGFSEEAIASRLSDAIRELTEEMGYVGEIKFIQPSGDSKICMNPTNTRSNETHVVYAELVGDSWQQPTGDGHETFNGFRFYSMPELFNIFRLGKTPSGASVREGPHSAAILAFLGDFKEEILILK